MKYEAMLRAVPEASLTIAKKHALFFAGIADMPEPWGLAGPVPPPAPDPGRDLLAEIRLNGLLGAGVRGSIVYRYRGGLRSEAMCDDFMRIEFNPMKQNWDSFVNVAFPTYIRAFDAYRAQVGDVRFSEMDFEAKRTIDARHGVYRIYPVNYFGPRLCEESFALTPSRLLEVLRPVVERVQLLGEGILIVAGTQPIEIEEAEAINKKVWPRIKSAAGQVRSLA